MIEYNQRNKTVCDESLCVAAAYLLLKVAAVWGERWLKRLSGPDCPLSPDQRHWISGIKQEIQTDGHQSEQSNWYSNKKTLTSRTNKSGEHQNPRGNKTTWCGESFQLDDLPEMQHARSTRPLTSREQQTWVACRLILGWSLYSAEKVEGCFYRDQKGFGN